MDKLFVSNKNETVRMFDSRLMEFFSHVHPATPVILYGPLIVLVLYLSFAQKKLSVLAVLAFFVFGVLVWTLLEYVIHRSLFHSEPKPRIGKLLHFIMHGVHHDYPNDATRLV